MKITFGDGPPKVGGEDKRGMAGEKPTRKTIPEVPEGADENWAESMKYNLMEMSNPSVTNQIAQKKYINQNLKPGQVVVVKTKEGMKYYQGAENGDIEGPFDVAGSAIEEQITAETPIMDWTLAAGRKAQGLESR